MEFELDRHDFAKENNLHDLHYTELLEEAAGYIEGVFGLLPDTAVVLGSGMNSTGLEIKVLHKLHYGSIPGFAPASVSGHKGILELGELSDKKIAVLNGRLHYYEGFEPEQIVFPMRALGLAGVKTVILTNAAGGINRSFSPGDIMLIEDHISLFAEPVLRGRNHDRLGTRFPDMKQVYSNRLNKLAEEAAQENGVELKSGVYAYTKGPAYETPAEIRALSAMGADAVGMSTVYEAIAAKHMGMEILGLSLITNKASGIGDKDWANVKELTHEEVIEVAKKSADKMNIIIRYVITRQ